MKFLSNCCTLHRGAFCQFPFRWIYYCHSSKSTGKETEKMHLCALVRLNGRRKLNGLDLSKSAKDQWKSESCFALTSFHFVVKTVGSCLALTFWKIKQKPIRRYVMYYFLKVANFCFSFHSTFLAGSLKPASSLAMNHSFNLFWRLQLQIKCLSWHVPAWQIIV